MSPTYNHNDYLVSICWVFMQVQKGNVVVISHPTLNNIVKRVLSIDKLGRMRLSGDNLLSVDSAGMGWVDKKHLIGKVILRFAR